MAALTVQGALSRIRAAVDGVTHWKLSHLPFDRLPEATRAHLHRTASVWAPRTDFTGHAGIRPRQQVSEPHRVKTTCLVEWAWAITANDDPTSPATDTALGGELSLIQAIMGVSLADLHVAIARVERRLLVTHPVSVHGVITVELTHQLALE